MALILVTGASTGLGLAAAIELADDGHDVVVHARTPERVPGDDTARWAGAVIGDLSDLEATADVARQANEFGRFDAVIHNAGALRSPEVVPVNIVAPYVLTAAMRKPGRLIYLSSSMHRSGSVDLDRAGIRNGDLQRHETVGDDDEPGHRSAMARHDQSRRRPRLGSHPDGRFCRAGRSGRRPPNSDVAGDRSGRQTRHRRVLAPPAHSVPAPRGT